MDFTVKGFEPPYEEVSLKINSEFYFDTKAQLNLFVRNVKEEYICHTEKKIEIKTVVRNAQPDGLLLKITNKFDFTTLNRMISFIKDTEWQYQRISPPITAEEIKETLFKMKGRE